MSEIVHGKQHNKGASPEGQNGPEDWPRLGSEMAVVTCEIKKRIGDLADWALERFSDIINRIGELRPCRIRVASLVVGVMLISILYGSYATIYPPPVYADEGTSSSVSSSELERIEDLSRFINSLPYLTPEIRAELLHESRIDMVRLVINTLLEMEEADNVINVTDEDISHVLVLMLYESEFDPDTKDEALVLWCDDAGKIRLRVNSCKSGEKDVHAERAKGIGQFLPTTFAENCPGLEISDNRHQARCMLMMIQKGSSNRWYTEPIFQDLKERREAINRVSKR